MEAACPGLFVDKHGTYWDVPLSLAIDLASVPLASGLSYHLCLQHNSGQPKPFAGSETSEPPLSLLPGFCAKAAISIKKSIDVWRKKEGKLRMVQPYDVLLSDPHVSASAIIGKPYCYACPFFSISNFQLSKKRYECYTIICYVGEYYENRCKIS